MSIDTNRAIIAAVGLGIILLNLGIIYALLTGSAQQQLEVLRRIFTGVRRPWQGEDESLTELRERVQRLHPEDNSQEEHG